MSSTKTAKTSAQTWSQTYGFHQNCENERPNSVSDVRLPPKLRKRAARPGLTEVRPNGLVITTQRLAHWGLAARPWSCRRIVRESEPAEFGSREMRVLLSANGARVYVEPMAELAEECGPSVATSMMPSGVWG
jgi:hypothetical protein